MPVKKTWRQIIENRSGIALLECLIYVVALTVIMSLGAVYLVRLRAGHERQQRLVDGTVKAIMAGRTVKRDIAGAAAVGDEYGEHSTEDGRLILRTDPDDALIYLLDDGTLFRLSYRDGTREHESVVLRGVEDFSFLERSEGAVRFMVVNIRLAGQRGGGRFAPAFTFKAVLNPPDAVDADVRDAGYDG